MQKLMVVSPQTWQKGYRVRVAHSPDDTHGDQETRQYQIVAVLPNGNYMVIDPGVDDGQTG